MLYLVAILIILACVVMAFFVLVQNPKGGGLSGTFGGMSTQVMGVQRSGDVMEKGTWVSIIIIGILCITCVVFYPKMPNQNMSAPPPQSAPAPTTPLTPAP